jgi:hypothetical protein
MDRGCALDSSRWGEGPAGGPTEQSSENLGSDNEYLHHLSNCHLVKRTLLCALSSYVHCCRFMCL